MIDEWCDHLLDNADGTHGLVFYTQLYEIMPEIFQEG